MGCIYIPFHTDKPVPPGQHTVVVDLEKCTLIKNVIFNDPATIVIWADGTKTVVKAGRDFFDEEKGLAMAICKKIMGNRGSYYNVFKKWLPKPEPGTFELIETFTEENLDFENEKQMNDYYTQLDELKLNFNKQFFKECKSAHDDSEEPEEQ
jgi:hypothetical protein